MDQKQKLLKLVQDMDTTMSVLIDIAEELANVVKSITPLPPPPPLPPQSYSGKPRGTANPLWKTQMCWNVIGWDGKGKCPCFRGADCDFAHTREELRH
jgi:hypothetical protein